MGLKICNYNYYMVLSLPLHNIIELGSFPFDHLVIRVIKGET